MHLRHRWDKVDRRLMRDVSFGWPGIMRTDFYERCGKCGKRRVRSVGGWW